MTTKQTDRETPLSVFAAIGPFSDELIGKDALQDAVDRLKAMDPLDAVRLVLAVTHRSDTVVEERELANLAEFLGVFEDDEDGEDE